MPRFAILEHDHPVLHWDFLLEADGVLHTWRLADPPLVPGQFIEATAVADHRLIYLDYEGPVSGGRGTVAQWDAGDFVDEAESQPTARRIRLAGKRVRGRVFFDRVEGSLWRFCLEAPVTEQRPSAPS